MLHYLILKSTPYFSHCLWYICQEATTLVNYPLHRFSRHFSDQFLGNQFDPTGYQIDLWLLLDGKIKCSIQDASIHCPAFLSYLFPTIARSIESWGLENLKLNLLYNISIH